MLKKIDKLSVYYKLILLIFITSTAFILLFSSLFYYILKQEDEVYEQTQKQLDEEITSLMKLNAEPPISTIIDVTYWDELVSFVSSRDQDWFQNSIASTVDMYSMEFIGVYDLQGNQVGNAHADKLKAPITFVTQSLLTKLNQKKIMNFFVKLPEGYGEVFMATIHPSNDPNKNKTTPKGYFVMMRLLDDDYKKRLQEISSCSIAFTDSDSNELLFDDFVKDIYTLKSWDGTKIVNLAFQRKFYVNFNTTEKILFVIFLFFLAYIISSLLFLRKWISHPLTLTTKILETGDKKAINELKESKGEFNRIARLFEESFSQKKLLEKAKAKAEESDQLKTAFLTNLSHEIRTPMNAILGFSDLLNNKEIDEKEKKDYIEIITKSGGNLVSIIDDLIEMSKIDAHQVTPNLSSLDIDDCVQEIYQSVKITISKDKNIQFILTKPDEALPHPIFTDVVKLKQILINLLTNAIKFTTVGSIELSYKWSPKKNQLLFCVKDTGLGIDKQHQKSIFDRFRRVEGDYSIKVGGLGLGLSITKAYVEMMGGTISLKSELGVGSKFKFTLPVMFDKRTEIIEEPVLTSTPVTITTEIKPKTILIAEDDNINFLLFDKLMQNSNFTIIRAKDGEEAIALFYANQDVDLVLMDIKMPKKSGYEALKEIKLIKPTAIVVAQTAFSSSDEIEKIQQVGFDAHITKPINKEKLFDLMTAILN